ncbi:MAG: hypothetical protein U0361_02860 [Nitrospiraceae bacterium]
MDAYPLTLLIIVGEEQDELLQQLQRQQRTSPPTKWKNEVGTPGANFLGFSWPSPPSS